MRVAVRRLLKNIAIHQIYKMAVEQANLWRVINKNKLKEHLSPQSEGCSNFIKSNIFLF